MAMPETVLHAMDEARSRWETAASSLYALKRHFDTSDEAIARAMGFPVPGSGRQIVQSRLSGATKITPWELAGFAAVFGVPQEVLFEGPEASVRWVLDHPDQVRQRAAISPFSEQPRRRSGWFDETAGTTAA